MKKLMLAKKNYKCECCGANINLGDKYLRININRIGIFHYCIKCAQENKPLKYKNYYKNLEESLETERMAYDNTF